MPVSLPLYERTYDCEAIWTGRNRKIFYVIDNSTDTSKNRGL